MQLGFTPLHWASNYGHTECVRLLVEAGADVAVKDWQERTALDLACESPASRPSPAAGCSWEWGSQRRLAIALCELGMQVLPAVWRVATTMLDSFAMSDCVQLEGVCGHTRATSQVSGVNRCAEGGRGSLRKRSAQSAAIARGVATGVTVYSAVRYPMP